MELIAADNARHEGSAVWGAIGRGRPSSESSAGNHRSIREVRSNTSSTMHG